MNVYEQFFDIKNKGKLYVTYDEQLNDCLRMMDMYYFLAYASQKERISSDEEKLFHLRGTIVLPSQMEWALLSGIEKNKEAFSAEVMAQIESAWDYLESRIPPVINHIRNMLYQVFTYIYEERYEKICFLLGLSYRMDRKYEKMIGYLQDNIAEHMPTLSMAQLFSSFTEHVSVVTFLDDRVNFYGWSLLFRDPLMGFQTPLDIRECIYLRMLGRIDVGEELKYIISVMEEDEQFLASEEIHKEMIEEIESLFYYSEESHETVSIMLDGKNGSGRKYLARKVGYRIKRDLLQIKMDEMVVNDERHFVEIVENMAAICVVNGYIPVVTYNGEEVNQARYVRLLKIFQDFEVNFIFTAVEVVIRLEKFSDLLNMQYRIPELTPMESEQLWRHYGKQFQINFEPSIDIQEMATRYRLLPAQIAQNLQMIHVKKREAFVYKEDIGSVIRKNYEGYSLQHGKKVRPFFTMNDLILPDETKNNISYIIKRIQKENFVNEKWAFGKKYAYGRGIGILLYGRSGTGKSMCAHVIANELELDLLQVDLSSIMSKYVGETEKNLSEVFLEAEKTNTILFFDEADSLFSQRAKDMGGANDRYANLETAHLLQKIEEFRGICILTTNMAMNFDKAFFRRFEFMINIPYPDVQTRCYLWENAFPKECKRDEYLPLNLIAEQFEFSPSDIKTIARSAAFQAACGDSEVIKLEHIVAALQMDFQKNGKVMPALLF